MYNLIVSGGPNSTGHDSLSASRLFEHTDDNIQARFQTNGQIDTETIKSLPALIMEEGLGDEIARVGWISRMELVGKDLHFHYQLDQSIPPLTNSRLFDFSSELGIGRFEFSRNHWAIKNVDLMHFLLRRELSLRPQPKVFQLSTNPVNPSLVSFMMPFSMNFDRIHDSLRSAVEGLGYQCQRADNFWQHAHIMQDIVELICTSQVVICDLSTKNPNVFYEAGIAHMLGKEVILITQSMDDVPFDLRALRCITYLNNAEGCQRLEADVRARLQSVMP